MLSTAGMHRGHSQEGDTGPLHECEVKTCDHIAFQVHSCWYGRVVIGRSSEEGPNTGCLEKALLRCITGLFVGGDLHPVGGWYHWTVCRR